MSKQLWITNLKKAIEIIEATPEQRIDLQRYEQQTDCGTLHCAAGELACDPHFIEQGFVLQETSEHCDIKMLFCKNAPDRDAYDGSELLFGPDAWVRLFSIYGTGKLDSEFLPEWTKWYNGEEPYVSEESSEPKEMSHKALALLRLRKQLALVETME